MLYTGLWRGIVVDNDDSDHPTIPRMGRIKVRVDEVHGSKTEDEDLPWAWPCTVAGGGRSEDGVLHGSLAIPPVGSSVWVSFEHGDASHPVWMGTWWGTEAGTKASDDRTTEVPQEAIEDVYAGVSYPDIYVFKLPFSPGANQDRDIYVRCSGSKVLEIHFGSNEIVFDNTGDDGELRLKTLDWNIKAETTYGDITLSAPDGTITLDARNIEMNATENITATAAENMFLKGVVKAIFASAALIQGQAPKAEGFVK